MNVGKPAQYLSNLIDSWAVGAVQETFQNAWWHEQLSLRLTNTDAQLQLLSSAVKFSGGDFAALACV